MWTGTSLGSFVCGVMQLTGAEANVWINVDSMFRIRSEGGSMVGKRGTAQFDVYGLSIFLCCYFRMAYGAAK